MRLSKKYPAIILIATGIAFIVSGIDCLGNNLFTIAVLSFIVGGINIIASPFVTRHPFFIKIFLLIINSAFAFLSSYIYFRAGKDYIQYGWAAVGIISIIAIVRAYVKRGKGEIKL